VIESAIRSYTNGCLCSNVTADDGHGEGPKRGDLDTVLEIKAKIQLHLGGYTGCPG
jgi:hypothetical protein